PACSRADASAASAPATIRRARSATSSPRRRRSSRSDGASRRNGPRRAEHAAIAGSRESTGSTRGATFGPDGNAVGSAPRWGRGKVSRPLERIVGTGARTGSVPAEENQNDALSEMGLDQLAARGASLHDSLFRSVQSDSALLALERPRHRKQVGE